MNWMKGFIWLSFWQDDTTYHCSACWSFLVTLDPFFTYMFKLLQLCFKFFVRLLCPHEVYKDLWIIMFSSARELSRKKWRYELQCMAINTEFRSLQAYPKYSLVHFKAKLLQIKIQTYQYSRTLSSCHWILYDSKIIYIFVKWNLIFKIFLETSLSVVLRTFQRSEGSIMKSFSWGPAPGPPDFLTSNFKPQYEFRSDDWPVRRI